MVLQEVLMEKISFAWWKRLETLYATMFLANHLVLKQRLFTFRMNEGDADSNEEDVADANLTDESGDDFLLVSTSDNSKLTSEWIQNSGCSFYMCPNREWFSTYSLVVGGVECMRNDSSSKVIGIGTIKIRMHDGMIKALSDVKYVLDL
ncbi:hypothetical protein J1N35_028991 [Gossypium stocksii]|uniref:Retrovirus-related Pol polyprotein from transposon TNT 1-94-like beta-barrel domain-containing protein n=1 Tax=Gossypium stocksii TaxID=47602 RepID=A0A9D3UXX5_9ROSI|nr:hypothetical protein J1N35_028991 [Gossypium stocksii]